MHHKNLVLGMLVGVGAVAIIATASVWAPRQTLAAKPPTFGVASTSNVSYGPLPDEIADIYTPVGKKTGSTAFVLIHGGGWVSGSDHENSITSIANWLASQGYVVMSIDYRLVQGEVTTTPPNPDETNVWPDQIVDAQLAVRWLRTNAAAYNVHAHQICAMGDSAGGQLALMLGMIPYRIAGDESLLLHGTSPQADCVIDNSGPTNLDFAEGGVVPYEIAGLVDSLASSSLDAASPISYATATASPIAMTQGTEDPLAPPGEPEDLYGLLQSEGASTTLIYYDGGHVFGGLTWAQETAVLNSALTYVNSFF